LLLNLKRFELQLKWFVRIAGVNISKSNHRLSIPETVPVNVGDAKFGAFKSNAV
jgi:hypothetical protein